MDSATVAILVGTDPNRRDECDRLVASLQAHTEPEWRLYVGDMAPPEVPLYRHADPRVVVRREWPPLGVSDGFNKLAELGAEPWVTWLNDDAEVCAGWATAAIQALESHSGAAMAALYYLTPHDPQGWHVNSYPFPDMPYANFGFMRRAVFQAAGGFDKRVSLYGMDNALCFRVLNGSPAPNSPGAGGYVLPVPQSRVVHHYREDTSRHERMDTYEAHRNRYAQVYAEWSPHFQRLRQVQRACPEWVLVLPEPETYASYVGGAA